MTSTSGKLGLCVAIAILASSCSYVTMQRPENLKERNPTWVSNRLAPTLDTVQAAGAGLSVIVFARSAFLRPISRPTDFAVGAAAGALVGSTIAAAIWTGSAVSGFQRAEACEEVKVEYFDERRAAPRTSSGGT